MTASAPKAAAAWTMRSSSVAMITRDIFFARRVRSHTRSIIGLPARDNQRLARQTGGGITSGNNGDGHEVYSNASKK